VPRQASTCPMNMGGKRFHMTCEVVECKRDPDGSVHWRGEFSGDSHGWEKWDLMPEDGGTLVAQEMEVSPLQGIFSRLAARLFVERMLTRNDRQSLENLKRLVESESASV
jgi:hypothetical protein